MCGIVGVFDLKGRRPVDSALVERMNDTLFHRGPDEGGIHQEPGIGLGHRRLSIIDLAGGQQPMANEDGSVWVTFNGEIYNFRALVRELESLGHTFRTRSDTEVIVHAWESWGPRCVDRFRGMFAFAIWDRNNRALFLARDRLGIKPLYYGSTADGHFIFGSELKALQAHPAFRRELRKEAVEEYLAFGYVPEPHTIFNNAYKLPPGHHLTVTDAGSIGPVEYWDVRFDGRTSLDEATAAEELRSRLAEAVDMRLVAEVPLGAFLSGGVDSSAVVATMARLDPERPVRTCSIGFAEAAFDETVHAEQVARRYGTLHHVGRVSPDDFSLVGQLAALYDEPFADSSAMPTYRVCEAARSRVTVALSGDGGDEVFAGYRRYRWHMLEERFRRRLPDPLRRHLFGALGRFYPKLDWAPRYLRAKTTFEAVARDTLDAYMDSVSVMSRALRQQLYSRQFQDELQGYDASEVLRRHARRGPADDPLELIQYLDIKTYLPGDILTKVDRASMAHALEVRVPLLDHEFVQWGAKLPETMKLRGREGKYLLKRAFEPHLPHEILYRPKRGFAVPLARWFRGPLRERIREAVTGDTLRESGVFEPRELERLVNEHLSGMREHSAALWSLLMFDEFCRGHAGDQPSQVTGEGMKSVAAAGAAG